MTTQGARRGLAKPDEIAEFLNVSPRTLTEWRYRRTGPPYHPVGRHVRYSWTDVEKWLAQQKRAVA